jgi:epoxyqueuosine reductase
MDHSNINQPRVNGDYQRIKSLALEVGFDDCGVSSADFLKEESNHLNKWLVDGMHGEMDYMERNLKKRVDPRILVPNAKTVISVIQNYFPGNPEISTTPPKLSRYALGRDYHDVIKDKLYLLLDFIRKEYGHVDGRVFVDSAPVLEKTWASKAGLGWIGKNSLLINQQLGSYFFIGELILDIEIKPLETRTVNRCGACTRCIDACPTGAIVAPSIIDSRKCISYLTIEKKSPLTNLEQQSLNGWCFGCDICQEVCPWNGKISAITSGGIVPKQEVLSIKPNELKSISKEKFVEIFSNTPLSRAGWEKVTSNCK